MWTHIAYRFSSDAAWMAALAAEGWKDGPPPDVSLIVSGTLYASPVDEETPGVALLGWHVAAAFRGAPPAAWADFVIEPPAQMAVMGRAAPVVPQEIPLRQLLFALRNQSWITHAEAMAAARTGDMPSTMVATLASAVQAGALTAQDVADAELTWAAMYTAERSNPIWALFVATGAATSAQVDALFIAAVLV